AQHLLDAGAGGAHVLRRAEGEGAGLVQHDRGGRPVASSASWPLTSSSAPRPTSTISAVGVASPSAQGQAMISMLIPLVTAVPASAPASSQPRITSAVRTSTPPRRARRRG